MQFIQVRGQNGKLILDNCLAFPDQGDVRGKLIRNALQAFQFLLKLQGNRRKRILNRHLTTLNPSDGVQQRVKRALQSNRRPMLLSFIYDFAQLPNSLRDR